MKSYKEIEKRINQLKEEINKLKSTNPCELGIITTEYDKQAYKTCPYCAPYSIYWCGYFCARESKKVRDVQFNRLDVGCFCPAWNYGKLIKLIEELETLKLRKHGWQIRYFSLVGYFLSPITEHEPEERRERVELGLSVGGDGIEVRTYMTENPEIAFMMVIGSSWTEHGFIKIPVVKVIPLMIGKQLVFHCSI